MSDPASAPYLPLAKLIAPPGTASPTPALLSAALRTNLAPLLLWAIKQRADPLDPALAAQLAPLQAQARQVAARYVLLKTVRAHVNATLAAAGIPALWLKGAALAETVYPQPVLRPMSDLDVLVPFERREEALAALKAAGYADETLNPLAAQVTAFLPPDETHHHYNLVGGPGGGVRVELHFRVARAILPDLAALDWFWSQAVEATNRAGAPLGFLTLRPEAHLLYLCAHALLQHGEAQTDLLHVYDLHLLATVCDLDWALIVERAAILRWTYPVERALTLAQEYFGTPLPAGVLEELRARRPADEDTGIVQQIGAGDTRWAQTVRGLRRLTPRQRIALVWWIIFPPRAYLRTRYQVRPGVPLLLYYPYRWWDQARGIARGVRRWVSLRMKKDSLNRRGAEDTEKN